MPEGATWRQMAGIGSLAGIGFTMSLFIGILAFGEGALMDQVRVGVLAGSLVATLIGVALLWQQSEAPSQRSRSRP
jgi:NhaA family Na+:H+ antiporter